MNPGPSTLLYALFPSIGASFVIELLLGLNPIEHMQLRGHLGSAIPKLEPHHLGVLALDVGGQMLCEQI